VKYLLDVSVLVALGFRRHIFHARVAEWERELSLRGIPEFATCPITELGFVRTVAHPAYGRTVATAKELLRELKSANSVRFTFIPDELDAEALPYWVETANQTTDGTCCNWLGRTAWCSPHWMKKFLERF
jgi:predicted nucleic acid-binding protein